MVPCNNKDIKFIKNEAVPESASPRGTATETITPMDR